MGTSPRSAPARKFSNWIVFSCVTCFIIPFRIREISPSIVPKSQCTNQEESVLWCNSEVGCIYSDPDCKLRFQISVYTGYIDIEARHIFFYFFESRNNPATDDVIFWTNGGRSMPLIPSENWAWTYYLLWFWNYKDLVARRLLGYSWSLVRLGSSHIFYPV